MSESEKEFFDALEYSGFMAIAQNPVPDATTERIVNDFLEIDMSHGITSVLWAGQSSNSEYWIKFAVLRGATDINDPLRYLVIDENIVDTHKGCRSFDEAKEVFKPVQSCKTVKEYEDIDCLLSIRLVYNVINMLKYKMK